MVTRREFLKVAGIGGEGAAAGAAGGYAFRALSGPPPGSAIGGELAIYNWSYYLFEPLLDEFRRQTGVSAIRYDTFESGDQVWQGGGGGRGGGALPRRRARGGARRGAAGGSPARRA